jgi:transcriptional regulator with XRE-family HTH domain
MTDKELRKAQKAEADVQIGIRTKKIREDAGKTQEEFAEQLNVSSQYISDVERGVAGLSILVAIAIHKYYSISCDWLLTGRTQTNDISQIVEKLKYIDSNQLSLIEENINNILQMIAFADKQGRQSKVSKI